MRHILTTVLDGCIVALIVVLEAYLTGRQQTSEITVFVLESNGKQLSQHSNSEQFMNSKNKIGTNNCAGTRSITFLFSIHLSLVFSCEVAQSCKLNQKKCMSMENQKQE